MSKGRLTRQELGWLLTQEAQGAAERLRKGVAALKTQVPPRPDSTLEPAAGVETTLEALDDAMRILSSLHQRPVSGNRGRRGRIDLASVLWEVAPEARVSMEPGSGTEVLGDEAELRRMLHVLVGHGTGSGSAVTIKREGDFIRVSVVLGPDSSATAEAERAWLSRMAIRYGGEYELEGGMESLTLLAEGVDDRDEREALRKELDEARKQGEAYARELAQLAQIASQSEEPAFPSTLPPPLISPTAERLSQLTRFAGGIAVFLREMLAPVSREAQQVRSHHSTSSRASSPDLDPSSRSDDPAEVVRRGLLRMQDFIGELGSVGELDPNEIDVDVDLTESVRTAVRSLEGRAMRAGVEFDVVLPAAGPASMARVPMRACSVMLREVIMHAVIATPRGSRVSVKVDAAEDRGPRVIVDDCGTALPGAARRGLLCLEVDAGTYGRPSALPLYIASELTACQRGILELSDSPGGGVRVTVSFPR